MGPQDSERTQGPTPPRSGLCPGWAQTVPGLFYHSPEGGTGQQAPASFPRNRNKAQVFMGANEVPTGPVLRRVPGADVTLAPCPAWGTHG